LLIAAIIRWAARISAALIAIVFAAFVFGEPSGSLRAIHFRHWVAMALLFGAVLSMLLAWKWEFPAALISLFSLAAFAVVVHMNRYDVLAVAAIPNILFLLDWKLRHPQKASV